MGGWHVAEPAAEQFLFYGVVFPGEFGNFVAGGAGGLILSALAGGGCAGSDFVAGLAVPFDEGGLRDAELAADAGQAEAVEAEADEFVADGVGVHQD